MIEIKIKNCKIKKYNTKNKKKKIVLILVGTYIPGYKAGGPIQSIKNLVDCLSNDFEFKIITSDRDFGDNKAYNKIKHGIWNKIGQAKVYYLMPNEYSLVKLREILNSSIYNICYLNSFFSPIFTIKPLILRKFGLIKKVPLIIAPRGEFSEGALKLKKLKKYLYLKLVKLFGLYNDIIWQASSKYEEKDIRQCFGNYMEVIVAPNIPSSNTGLRTTLSNYTNHKKITGKLKIVFLSRIARKKNLYSALKMLESLKGEIQFNIYGSLKDPNYWVECKRVINFLPNNIRVQYMGPVEHDKVSNIIRKHDLFFLTTLGENYGHAILEALVAGCPVLISDQTPWRKLEEKGVGWDLPLNCPEKFREVLQKCIDMNEQEYNVLSRRAHNFGLKIVRDKTTLNLNRKLFYRTFYGSN